MKHNWEYKKLGEIASLVVDGDWIESKDQSESGIRLIQTGNVGNGVFKPKNDKPHYITEETFNRLGCTEIFEGDCLVSRLPDPIGRACLIPNMGNRMITAVDCSIIRFDNLYLPQMFVYFSQSSRYADYISNSTKGSTRKRISRKNLETIPIPLPPLPIQQKIVAELDKVCLIIDKKKQQLKELDNLAQAIFYDMFGDPVENEKGWDVKKLDEVCDVRDGTHDSPKYIDGGEYILITSKNIVNGKIDYSNISYITKEDYDAINKRSKVDDGDIIMAMIGTIGKPIIVKMENYKFCIKNVALIKFLKDSMVSNVYIQALLNSSSFSQHIMSKNQGGTQKFVSLGTIRKLEIPLPPLSLQQSFATKIEAIEKQKELISRSIKEAQTLFDERMDYWFD